MVKENSVRIKHMIDASEAIFHFIQNRRRDDLDNDLMLFSAIIRQLEILGEAATGLSQDFKEQNSFIPWSKIIGMRNRLIHAYFDVDADIVWQAITVEVPNILPQLEKLI